MSAERTAQKLASITDPGHFEGLATAVLWYAEPLCKNLHHSGVNPAGQTIPSPLDGICFVPGADPPHMVAVHHTIVGTRGLRKKWLNDSAAIKHRKETKHEAPDGDLIKTAAIVRDERQRRPNLRVTLVLSTNQQPSDDLLRDVDAAGAENGIDEVVIWSQSRFCGFLDNEPTGQWIRRKHLGIEEELLSIELLRDLSKKSLETYEEMLQDLPSFWVNRALDGLLDSRARSKLTFVVGGAGSGKSVACYRRLKSHLDAGGVGILVRHEDVASATHLEEAVMTSLRRLHPTVAPIGPTLFSLCSPGKPLLLVVEDINHAPQPRLLVERLARWAQDKDKSVGSRTQDQDSSDGSDLPPWRILCPSWPVEGLQDRVPKGFEETLVMTSVFAPDEGREAVLRREEAVGCVISPLKASEISEAFGHDPLLIALHKPGEPQNAHQVIERFVEGALCRAAEANTTVTSGECREALRVLAREMLQRRQLDLVWREIRAWDGLRDGPIQVLTTLAKCGELLRLTGPSADQHLSFRHDRVRDWLLSDAAADMQRRGVLSDELLQDSYFAEVFGDVLTFDKPSTALINRVAAINPLALFYCLRLLSLSKSPAYTAIHAAAMSWLNGLGSQNSLSTAHLRAEVLKSLCETDSPEVPTLVRKLGAGGSYADVALLRNGDLAGGIRLCALVEPGCEFPWRDLAIEHAKVRYGGSVIEKLRAILIDQTVDGQVRSGALRLAGHIADQGLVFALEECWKVDVGRAERLDDYLWAFAKCCGPDVARYLAPVCDAWGSLSDVAVSPGMGSPRFNLTVFGLEWALRRQPPQSAIEYLVFRAESDLLLRRPITYILDGVDLPCAVEFIARERAGMERRLAGSGQLLFSGSNGWRRAQEQGRPMSAKSRAVLLRLWHDRSNDKHLRGQAFALWAETTASGDLEVLRGAPDPDLADQCLWERLRRSDEEAVPALLDKLKSDENWNWWQVAHHVWSGELTAALDESLARRATYAPAVWGRSIDPDLFTSELVKRLPEIEAARLLQKHWTHLRFSDPFVQAALYVGTPPLLALVRAAVSECPNPRDLFKHITLRYRSRMLGSSYLIREAQVVALEPYLNFLEPMALRDLWEACNKHQWFDTRRRLLDGRQNPPFLPAGREKEEIAAALERFLSHDYLHGLDRLLDHYLDAGIAWANLLAWMTAWLEQKRSVKALNLVATAITLRGGRKDLDVLNICNNMPEVEAKHLVANTRFVVLRSRLS